MSRINGVVLYQHEMEILLSALRRDRHQQEAELYRCEELHASWHAANMRGVVHLLELLRPKRTTLEAEVSAAASVSASVATVTALVECL